MKNSSLAVLLCAALVSACAKPESKTAFLASDRPLAPVYSIDKDGAASICDSIPRGLKLVVRPSETMKIEKTRYVNASVDGSSKESFWIDEATLADSLEACVLEKELYVRTPASVIRDTTCSEICSLAEKGERLDVIGYDRIGKDGRIRRYKIRQNTKRGVREGYVFAKYLVFDKDEAMMRYRPERYDTLHAKVRDPFGGGRPEGCDFYPVEKPSFPGKALPRECRSLYLNISPAGVGRIDKFIELAKSTLINTFVIDIKDNECPGYKAEAMEKYSPTNFKWGGKNKADMYRNAVKRLHEEGFWVVGRITCFKDSYFIKDNPSTAITEKATGKPFFHNKAYWPSAYDRRVWQFNVELAKEAVRTFGFDEINFDYVRFPDRMTSVEDLIDYHNVYNESKVQAIQRFVQYACDEIHTLGAYVSIDVFGESANQGYTTAYGQYWPALSNVADVMCGMPYPDHFANHSYGIDKPWNHPYEVLNAWGRHVTNRQSECETPAQVRTWVQSYHVMRWVDKNGIDYDAENIAKEIRGLYDAGLDGGYVTWLASSNYDRYVEISDAFRTDYRK